MPEPQSGLESGGLRRKSSTSFPAFYGFEDGTVDAIDQTPDLAAVTDKVYDGTYAAYADDSSTSGTSPAATETPSATDGGREISQFRFYWLETSDQTGGGLRLWSSSGNVEVGMATDNPQWFLQDGNGFNEVYAGDGYDRWIRVLFEFDWSSALYNVEIEDLQSGSSFIENGRPLANGQDFEYFTIAEHNQGAWNSGSSLGMWFDNIKVGAL